MYVMYAMYAMYEIYAMYAMYEIYAMYALFLQYIAMEQSKASWKCILHLFQPLHWKFNSSSAEQGRPTSMCTMVKWKMFNYKL